MHFHYPFKIDGRGHTAEVQDEERHIRHLIEQVLFTDVGERVNRPNFGTKVNQLVFAPNNEELSTSTQFLIQGALQQWLGDLIHIISVETNSENSLLKISIEYQVRGTNQTQVQKFSRQV
jgi:uncharacterized protein